MAPKLQSLRKDHYPFLTFAVLTFLAALLFGLVHIIIGDGIFLLCLTISLALTTMSRMIRYRLIAQGITPPSLIAGIFQRKFLVWIASLMSIVSIIAFLGFAYFALQGI